MCACATEDPGSLSAKECGRIAFRAERGKEDWVSELTPGTVGYPDGAIFGCEEVMSLDKVAVELVAQSGKGGRRIEICLLVPGPGQRGGST